MEVAERTRMKPAARREQLLEHAMRVAEHVGFSHFTRAQVARAAGVSDALVSAHWNTMGQLRRSIMREAVRAQNVTLVAQGLCARDTVAMKAPKELKERAALSLAR